MFCVKPSACLARLVYPAMGLTIPVDSKKGGTIAVYRGKKKGGADGWRCVLNRPGKNQKRLYGCMLDTITATVSALMDKYPDWFGTQTRATVLQKVMQFEARNRKGDGSQPIRSSTSGPVRYVHQMYGLFRDDKPMSDLFQRSKAAWQQVAADMGATYILWSADEIDTMVREHYPQIWDMYTTVRYPIMRADMGRVAILHRYGGLYSDLDVFPNRSEFEQAWLAVCIQPSNIAKNPHFLEMEVLIAAQGNAMLPRWLEFMKLQIANKPFMVPTSFWHNAKMRYVYNTTGPSGMRRFLRLKANKEQVKLLQYLHINRPEKAKELTFHGKKAYDVISHQSMSYKTNAVSLPTRVSESNVDLPPVTFTPKRLTKKTRVSAMAELSTKAPQTEEQRDTEAEMETRDCELVLTRAELKRVSCMLDVERSYSRELITRMFSEEYNDRCAQVLGSLPPVMRAWAIPCERIPRSCEHPVQIDGYD